MKSTLARILIPLALLAGACSQSTTSKHVAPSDTVPVTRPVPPCPSIFESSTPRVPPVPFRATTARICEYDRDAQDRLALTSNRMVRDSDEVARLERFVNEPTPRGPIACPAIALRTDRVWFVVLADASRGVSGKLVRFCGAPVDPLDLMGATTTTTAVSPIEPPECPTLGTWQQAQGRGPAPAAEVAFAARRVRVCHYVEGRLADQRLVTDTAEVARIELRANTLPRAYGAFHCPMIRYPLPEAWIVTFAGAGQQEASVMFAGRCEQPIVPE